MGWKGTVKKIQAANRKAIRNEEKRRRELVKKQKELIKLQELQAAAYEVDVYMNQLEVIKTIHKDCSEKWDWNSILTNPPFEKGRPGPNELVAENALKNYKPSLMDKLFSRQVIKEKQLNEDINTARLKDAEEYNDWEELTEVANKVLNGDMETYLQVINEIGPFQDIAELGSSITFIIIDTKTIEVSINVHSEKVIPNQVKNLTTTGKLSTKNMPKGQYYELYQDYVCGSVLRVARELFALIPLLEVVYVHAISEILNTTNGLLEDKPVLSIMIPNSTIEKMNFNYIDCSDSMAMFVHNMKFSKTKGFNAVEKLAINTIAF